MDRTRFPVDPWRLVETKLLRLRPRSDRDPVRGRQRLPRPAWQRRGGSSHACARHLHQRLPRDLGDPARRGGVRLRPRRPDHRQRAGRQDDQALHRRRAAAAVGRRPVQLRAHPRLRRRRAAARDRVAYAGRQEGADRLAADGVVQPAPPGRDDARGDDARRRGAGGDLVAVPQPPRRRRTSTTRRWRPWAKVSIRARPSGSTSGCCSRRCTGATTAAWCSAIQTTNVEDDDRLRGRPHDRDRELLHRAQRGRRGHGEDRLPSPGQARPDDQPAKAVVYHTSRGVPVQASWSDRCRRTLDRVAEEGIDQQFAEQRAWMDAYWARSDVEIPGQPEVAAGGAMEPVPTGPGGRSRGGDGHSGEGSQRLRVRRPLLLGHRGLRDAVPHVHLADARAQRSAVPLRHAAGGGAAGQGSRSKTVRCSRGAPSTARRHRPTTRPVRRSTTSTPTSPMR